MQMIIFIILSQQPQIIPLILVKMRCSFLNKCQLDLEASCVTVIIQRMLFWQSALSCCLWPQHLATLLMHSHPSRPSYTLLCVYDSGRISCRLFSKAKVLLAVVVVLFVSGKIYWYACWISNSVEKIRVGNVRVRHLCIFTVLFMVVSPFLYFL